MNLDYLPNRITSPDIPEGHVQGIAVDTERGFVYYSFTTLLLKTDLTGRPLGSVVRLAGHLGCITFCPEDGNVYGSLEQKHDAIGAGIIRRTGWDPSCEDAFYLIRFDTDKITRMDMDAEKDGVMTAVYLRDVVRDYRETDEASGKPHRYGCSGIDGLGYGPAFGAPADSSKKFMVCYGVYGDTSREDNDYQVISQYDPTVFAAFAKPLNQSLPHHSGPDHYEERYFFYTGNTVYGVQNLEYEPSRRQWLVAVYRGQKETFTNFPMFVIDGAAAPQLRELAGRKGEMGLVLPQAAGGLPGKAELSGLEFRFGQTGIAALGDGTLYFSQDGSHPEEKTFYTTLVHYKRQDDPNTPFLELA